MTKPKGKTKPAPVVDELAKRKAAFIHEIAEFLTKDQAKWSIKLAMGSEDAVRWSRLRSLTPLMGYPTLEEAEELLTRFLA